MIGPFDRVLMVPTVTLPCGAIVRFDDPRVTEAPPALLPKKRGPLISLPERVSPEVFETLPTPTKYRKEPYEAIDSGLESGNEFLAAAAGLSPLIGDVVCPSEIIGDGGELETRRGLEKLRLLTLAPVDLRRDPRWQLMPEKLRGRGRISIARKIEAMVQCELQT